MRVGVSVRTSCCDNVYTFGAKQTIYTVTNKERGAGVLLLFLIPQPAGIDLVFRCVGILNSATWHILCYGTILFEERWNIVYNHMYLLVINMYVVKLFKACRDTMHSNPPVLRM